MTFRLKWQLLVVLFSLGLVGAMCPPAPPDNPTDPKITESCEPFAAIFVKAGASPDGANGSSWATAFPTIAQAVEAAKTIQKEDPKVVRIAVAAGKYSPETEPRVEVDIQEGGKNGQSLGKRVRAVVYQDNLRNIELFGGYEGKRECTNDRKEALYEKTILDGRFDNLSNSSVHVMELIYRGDEAANTKISGFKIRGGKAVFHNKPLLDLVRSGGGIVLDESDQTLILEHLTIEKNEALMGGGLAIVDGSVTISDVMFQNNGANQKDSFGGAIRADFRTLSILPPISLSRVQFHQNRAGNGGAMALKNAEVNCSECTFTQNKAPFSDATNGSGGAIYADGKTHLKLDKSHFDGNSADLGGAISIEDQSKLELTTCKFLNNGALTDGGAIFAHGQAVVVELTDASFCANKAVRGGAIASDGKLTLFGDKNDLTNRFLKNFGTVSKNQGVNGIFKLGTDFDLVAAP